MSDCILHTSWGTHSGHARDIFRAGGRHRHQPAGNTLGDELGQMPNTSIGLMLHVPISPHFAVMLDILGDMWDNRCRQKKALTQCLAAAVKAPPQVSDADYIVHDVLYSIATPFVN